MEQVVELTMMALMVILLVFVAIKQISKHSFSKHKKDVGIVISKYCSKADEISMSLGYMKTRMIYCVKINCKKENKVFTTSQVMYELLEPNQRIRFEYGGDILYHFEML